MYNSILILDDSLTQAKKDVIYALKKTNVLVLEFNYASKTYEDLKNELNEIYQEREVLGDDLELQNILFLNTKFEHTNVFQSYLNNNKGFLLNIEVNDPNYNSWSKLTDLIDYCKSSFSLEHFDILDINHLYYSESWSRVFQHIHNQCDLSNSFMKLNYLSKSIIMDETNTNTLNTSSNWLKTLLNDFSDLNEDIMNLMNLYFTKNNEESNNLLNSSTLFNIDSSATLCNNYSLNSYISNKIRVLIIPCLQQNNNEQFALLVKQLNASSQNEILPIFLNDNESFESFSQKFVTLYNSFVSNIDTSNEHEIFMGIYLPPYWNDQPNPSNSISLSNQLQTISLELNNNQPSSGSIFSGIIQLIKTQYNYVSKLYFEFFNLSQNYSNNLNVIYKNLSTQEGFTGFVGFYFSYIRHLDKYHNIYKPEQDRVEIYNPYVNNMIYYDSGTSSYYYEESKHNIEYFLNIGNNVNFKTRDFIENVKIHNIILYNEELAHYLDEIQESLTPNTLLLKFSPDATTYESMKQQLLSLNEESNVDIKNVALFQHAHESSNIFIFLQDQDHTFYDVSNSDPELTTWSKFTEFTLFLQNDLHVSNFDLLMCQIYSDPNWIYILNKIESQLTSLNIRSSDDNTGHVMFDGDWVLESENVDVNMVYLYFNEKVLDVELVLTSLGNSQTIVISKDRRSLYCTGRSIDSTMTYSESSRASGAYFSKISFYNNSVDSRYNILDSDEYIKTVNYNQGIMILTTKNKLYGVGKNNNSSLATGNGTTYNYPVECLFKDGDVLSSKNVIQIVFTGFNFFVLMDDGTVYGAGSGGDNMLQPNHSSHQNRFVQCHQNGLQTGETYAAITGLNRGLMFLTSNNRVLQVGRGGSASARGHTNNKTRKTIGACLFTDSLLTNETIIKLLNINLNTGLYTNLGNIYMAGYNSKLHFGSGFNLNTHYPRFVRTSVSSIDGTIERLWQLNGFTLWVYTSTNKYFVRGENENNYNQALMNHTNNIGDWTEPYLDVYETFNDSHVLQFFDRGFHSKACVNEKGELFVWGNSGNWAYSTSGTNRSGTQININPPEQVYTSSTSSSSNYLTDVIYGPAFETNYFKDDFNLEIMETGSLTGSTAYNIPLISSFNTATDASSNTVLHFDSDSSYSDISYTLTTGIYKITNVPSSTPLALINNGQTDHIVYGGTSTESNSYGPNNSNYYNYVSGTMYIEVDSSFDPIGFYTTANSGSYLGTQGDLTYSAEAIEYSNISTDSTSASTNILASSSYFNIFKDVSSNYFGILSDNDEISGNVYDNYKFINYNTYQITNIPEQYKLAIVEVSSNDVTITGDTNKKSSHNIDGVSHDFYYGDISINASYGFNTLKLYVYNGLKSSVVELENNITFELPNVSLVQNEASRKVLTKDVFLKVYKNSATEYLIHFNENNELSGNFYDTYSIEDTGIYKFKSIPSRYLFGIKVNDNASSIEISGNDSNKSTYSAGGGNVDFYHGDLYVKINDLSYNISTYIYDTTTSTSVRVGSDSNEFIDFANFGISGPTPVFMTLNVSEKFNTYGGFNIINIDPSFSSQPYDDSRDFGVYKNQTYVINAPTAFPLALVGRLDQSDISYSGYSENQDGNTNIGGTDYPLYHGPVFFTINDDLSANNTLSFYTKNQYNLNTAGSIVYDASSEILIDNSINHYVENEDTYNIEILNKVIVTPGGTAYTLNSGTRGHNANITHRKTESLTIEFNNSSGLYIGTPQSGRQANRYSQYINSFVFMNSSQAGTWNFGLRTSDDDFASVYVLEGNYCWNSNMTYNSDTTSIITTSSPWTGTRYNDGVSYLSINDFLSYVDTNYPDANITKIIEIPQTSAAQVNGQYTFEANKPYSFLIYWRHNNSTYGTANTVIRFGAWKQGTTASSLPATGITVGTNYAANTSADIVPEFFYNSINLSSTPVTGTTTNQLVSRFVNPNKINKNTTFYKNEKLVVYKNGIYNINQIPPWYPITILNNGITNKITLSGNANKKITQDVSGTSYDFYYGDISFSVLDSFSDLSGVTLYSSYGGGSLVNNEYMIMMKEDSSLNEPLQQFMSMKIYTNGNGDPVYQLNDKSAILSNYKFGAYVGTYIIKDVPEAYSMAVINNDISDVISYSGTSTKGNYAGPDSIQYPFYYGTVTVTIKAFNEEIDGSYISLYSYNNGYMGAQNIIEISSNQVYNVMDQDLYLHGKGSSSVDTSITLEESETAMLEIEYIATTENETEATWSANYVKEGSNGSTSLTNSATGFQYNSDDNGPYFLVNSNTNVTLQTYPNQSYLFNMDSTADAVLCYEIWCYYSGDDGTISSTRGWLMGVETNWGPYIVVTDTRIGGIGTTPGATDNNTYSSLTNPGYITNNANKGQLLHIVGYWQRLSSNNHARGVYINGTHYPQETSSQSGWGNYPGFDSFNSGSQYFQVGGRGDNNHRTLGVRIYSFRIWHGDIRSKISTLYNAGPHANVNTGSSSSSSSSSSLTYFSPLTYQISAPTSSISLTESETAMLQTEFIAKTENATVSTWSANYVKAGSNGSTSLTNSNTMFQYNSDTTGPYFLVNSNTSIVTLQNYPNQSYLLNMDSTSGAVLCYEMWCYYSGDDGTMGLGWALGIETDWGPYISLNTSNMGGIGATPAANDNNTYSSLTSPGYITDTANKGQLLHIVAYWEQTATNNHNRGVYINGTHYPQENTNQSGYGGKPGFDSITNNFQVGAKGTGGNHAIGLRIYSFRIWHGDIRSKISTLYGAGAHAYVYTDSLDVTIENPTTYQNIDVSMTKYSYFTEKLPTSATSSTYTDGSGCKSIMLNGETSYDTNKVYSVYDGTYTISATSANAFAIINTDSSGTHPLVITDGTIETTKNSLYNTEISYNYYSGDVTFKVLGYFNNLVLIEHIDGSSNSQYTRIKYDETANPGTDTESGSGGGSSITTECLDISSSISVADGYYILNGNSSYDANTRFGVYIGSYEIHNVPTSHPLAILNNDASNNVTYSGSILEGNQEVDGVTYNYYSGTFRINIKDDFTSDLSALSLHCLNHGYMGGQNKIVYSTDCSSETPGYYIKCLDASNNVNIVSSNGNKYVFNNGSVYEPTRRFGLTSGIYYLNNISTNHPMAILNNDVSNVVTYSGSNATTQEVGGVTYNFYSGTITLTISGEFSGSLSAYCSNHGYMGTQNKFVYSHLCIGTSESAPSEEESLNKACLRTKSKISIPASITSTNGIILNYGYVNNYDSTLLYGLDIGSYLITDIPAQTPLAIFNHDVSNSLEYTGETLQLNMLNPNQSRYYNYYSGYVRLIIKSIPSDISYVSYGIFKNKEFHDETNKFIFDSACSTDDYYYDCIDTHSSIELSGNVIHVNKKSYETGSKKLAVYNGYVEFRHVPEDNPIAFISASNSNDISYQGLAYNKQTLTINSQNVDFYHGNVVLRILNDFDNDLVLHMKQTGSNTTTTLNLYYSDYCDYKASSNSLLPYVECLTFDNCMNFTTLSNHRQIGFNLDSDNIISTQRMYGFNVGLYKFGNIDELNAIRITNISNGDVFLSSDDFIEVQGINDVSENNYYYGDVFLHVTTDVSYLSLGNSNGIEFANQTYEKFNGKDRLFYSTECLTDESFYIDCLKQSSDISVNNGKIILNDESSYSSTTKYGLYLGNYVVNNIPSGHPLALLNNDISNLVTYSGSTLESTTNVDGVPYKFYSGTMYITVKGDFNTIDPSGLSLYCSNHGYMGAENIFKYSELCSTIGEGYYIEDLSNTITFNKVDDKILLNNESTYDEYKKYGLYVGTYTISNVPEEDALAITNKDFLSKIAYTGTQLKGTESIGDVSYSFYYGTVSIYVFEPIDDAKNVYPPLNELSFYSYTNGYLGGLEKLVYYDIPRNYSTLNYTICLNEESIIKIFNVDNSDNYTFNNSATYYDYKQYGMHIGKYILKDVPMSEPIALLNQDVSNVIVYNGKSNKKVVANDPSGNSRDFFFGNVEIEVTGDFGNLSVYSANGKYLGGENILTFTDFCETNGFVIECLELESSMNIYNNNFTLNNASFYNEFKKYGLTKGSYRITNIPSSQALTFINNDLSNVVIVTGDNIDLCGNFAGPDGNNYNFYTNELNLTIKDKFTGFLPLYSYSDSSHNNGAELFIYSDLCTSINSPQTFIHCLNNENTNDISLANNDTTKLLLDSGLVNHNSSLKYGVFTGNYIFDVPSSHPIAFLNVDVSNHVSYFGNEENKSLGSAPRGNENIEYEFYHGRVILNIFGNFNTLSYYIKDDNDPSGGSYMGGLNAIKYSDFCDDQQSTTGVACLTTTSSFNLIENGGSYVYTLNGASSIVNNRNYGVHENIYTLTDICENYPIAILNNGIEEKISYGGDDSDLCGNFTAPDGNNYDFYKNQIIFSVSDSSFNNLSFYVYNPPNSGYFGLQNKLVYSDLCEDTLAETDEVVEDILTTSFDQQAS